MTVYYLCGLLSACADEVASENPLVSQYAVPGVLLLVEEVLQTKQQFDKCVLDIAGKNDAETLQSPVS